MNFKISICGFLAIATVLAASDPAEARRRSFRPNPQPSHHSWTDSGAGFVAGYAARSLLRPRYYYSAPTQYEHYNPTYNEPYNPTQYEHYSPTQYVNPVTSTFDWLQGLF